MDSLENARCEYIQKLELKIDELETQLKDANNIIVKADFFCGMDLQMRCLFSKYLEKYNIERMGK